MKSRFTLLLLAPVITISALLLILGSAGAWYVHRVNKEVSEGLHEYIKSMVASEQLVLNARDGVADMRRFLRSGQRDDLDESIAAFRQNESHLRDLEHAATDDVARGHIELARRGHERLLDRLTQMERGPPSNDSQSPDAQAATSDELEALATDVLTPSQELLNYLRQVAQRHSDQNRELANRIGLGLLLLGTCGAMAGLLSGYAIARGLSRSLVQLSLPVRDTAGKLNEVVGPITLSADAGFTELEAVLRTIADQTSSVVQRLQASQREAMRAEQLAAVGQLAAGMAHELRNPLMSMKILVQTEVEKGASARLSGRDLSVLEEEIARLEHLLQTFLDFARPPRLEKRRLEVTSLVTQTLHLVSQRAAQQSVEVVTSLRDAPLYVDADPVQVRQIVLNLLLNALDATPHGGTITIEARRRAVDLVRRSTAADATLLDAAERLGAEDVPGEVVLTVSDTGPGLPADSAEQVFEPFFSTKETGLGLGLAICKRIAEAHGGSVTAENRAAGGAAFSVRLPASRPREADAEVAPAETGETENHSMVAPRGDATILPSTHTSR